MLSPPLFSPSNCAILRSIHPERIPSGISKMFDRRSLAVILLTTASVMPERIVLTADLTNTLTRYAWFASAAYSADCNIPPLNTTIEEDFFDFITDTQARLFRDDETREYILAFRGTSSIIDVITDLRQSLVDCTSALPLCANCTVSLFPSN